ncbi:hypothetical protein J4423_00750 [Candidatus Pacearchaeota archaeon]|nr:hypothetical protein [Candidatus Pacearchaeota archaeon]
MSNYRILKCEHLSGDNGQKDYLVEVVRESPRCCGLFGTRIEEIKYSGNHGDWRELPSDRKVNGQVERILNHALSQFIRAEKSRKN